MQLAKVKGTVVATTIVDGLQNMKLLLIQPLDHELRDVGGTVVACDTVMAGPNDIVYYVKSREASLALEPWFVPVDATIVGIVDDV